MVQKYRDCVRKIVFDTGFAIVGIENQDQVHYAMPVRIMLEDAAGYDRQLRHIRKRRRKVLELRSFEDIDCFRTDLREVFGFIKHSNDKNREWEFAFQNEETFQCLDEDAFDVIISVTGSAELEQIKDMYCEEGGKINMCEAILGMIEAGRGEGRTHGEDKIVAIIRKKYIKKKNLQIISDELELDYSYVKEVVDLIHEHPDWTDLQIGEALIMHDNF